MKVNLYVDSVSIEEYTSEDNILEITANFTNSYSNLRIIMTLYSTEFNNNRVLKSYQGLFPIDHPISFGNWGIVGFIFDRLAKTNLVNTNLSTDVEGVPEDEFKELYDSWFKVANLMPETESGMTYSEWRGEN